MLAVPSTWRATSAGTTICWARRRRLTDPCTDNINRYTERVRDARLAGFEPFPEAQSRNPHMDDSVVIVNGKWSPGAVL